MRVAADPPSPFVTLPLRAVTRDAEASTSGRTDATITLVSWNIGLRGLRQLVDASRTADRVAAKDEHGVSRQLGYGSVDALLASLGEEVHVVCLQETKLTGRGDLTPALACPPGWDSAFSMCRDANGKKGKSGYAGVATYFRAGMNVVGAEEGTARGLVVGAYMREREMPWQRWHLVDSSLSELERVAKSELTDGFSAQYASWVPALHKDKVRAEHGVGVNFIDQTGLFEIVGLETPSSVMDRRS